MRIQVFAISLLAALLLGCGDDEHQKAQISELQNKVLDLEERLNEAELKLVKMESRNMEQSSQVVSKTISTQNQSSSSSVPSNLSTQAQSMPSTREEMRAHSQRRMLLKKERVVIDRAKRTIQALLGQLSLDQLVAEMNKAKVLHPDGFSWTRPKLEAFMKEHRIVNRPKE